jgi:hypothetical protein
MHPGGSKSVYAYCNGPEALNEHGYLLLLPLHSL